jgi:hypothetical protein
MKNMKRNLLSILPGPPTAALYLDADVIPVGCVRGFLDTIAAGPDGPPELAFFRDNYCLVCVPNQPVPFCIVLNTKVPPHFLGPEVELNWPFPYSILPPPHLSLITRSFNGNTVRNFPTHGQLSAAQGNLTSCLSKL